MIDEAEEARKKGSETDVDALSALVRNANRDWPQDGSLDGFILACFLLPL